MFNHKSNKTPFKKANAFADLFSNPISIFEEKKKQNNKHLKLQSISKNESKIPGNNKNGKQSTNKADVSSNKKTLDKKHVAVTETSKLKHSNKSIDKLKN